MAQTPLEAARAYFSGDRFAADAGCVIEKAEKGYARCTLVLDERHRNAAGQVMGGVAYTLADFTFAVAANFGSDSPTVTLTAQISYPEVVRGSVLIAESCLIKDGRRNCFYEISVTDNLGTPVAHLSVTGSHL